MKLEKNEREGKPRELKKGVMYDGGSNEKLVRGIAYELVPGVMYDSDSDEPFVQQRKGDLSKEMEKIPTESTMESISLETQGNVVIDDIEEVERFPQGICVVSPSFITQPERRCQTMSKPFGFGNFRLILVQIEHHITDDLDGEKEKKFYIFQVVTDSQMFEGRVKFTDIEGPKWIREVSQGEAYLFPEKEARKEFIYYVHAVLETSKVPEQWLCESTGWRKLQDGKFYYIAAEGAVGHPEIPVCCKSNLFIAKKIIPNRENYIRETVAMLDICFNKKISSLLFLFNHVGMLTTLFEIANFPVRFIMGCIGVSNSKKTSVASLMTQLFNRDEIKPVISFTSTEGGLEMEMSEYGDAVLLIDDFMPGATRQRQNQLQNKLELVLRAYGDRIEKKRMMTFCKADAKVFFPVRGCCVITGEQISGSYSSMSRIIVLSQTAKDVDIARLSYYQGKSHMMSLYACDFLNYVTENFVAIVEFMKKKCVEIRNNQVFKVPRLAESYAVFVVVTDIVLTFLKSTQRFSDMELDALKKIFEDKIISVFRENEHRLVEQNIQTIILETLRENLSSEINFVEKSFYKKGQNAVIYDETFIYLKLDMLYLWMKEYVAKYDCTVALSDKRHLLTYLIELGIIESKKLSNGKMENSRKIVGLPQNHERYLYLSRKKLEDKMKEIE